jgi:ADP-ribose pyrophosphatase YjhB (NUDIX family)
MLTPFSFCHACGEPYKTFQVLEGFPRDCSRCGTVVYQNPYPVTVAVVPIYDASTGRFGVLVGERAIEPAKGTWGLPGGYLNPTDQRQVHGAVRELREETGIELDPDKLIFLTDHNDGRHALTFWLLASALSLDEVQAQFKPSDECPAVRVAYEPETLSFPSHTRALAEALKLFEQVEERWQQRT